MSGRIPKVGEVWRSSWGTDAEILCIHDGVVGYLGTGNGSGHHWRRLGPFLADCRPPSEPWEHPQPTTEWRTVCFDGHLGTRWDSAEAAIQYVRTMSGGAGVCPAVVECTVTPIDGTLKQVKP